MDKQILELLQKMDSRMESLEVEVKGIRSTLEEHGQILRALDERTQVLSAEAESTKYSMAEVKGELSAIKGDVLDIKDALNSVEVVTARNWSEIVKLKSVK